MERTKILSEVADGRHVDDFWEKLKLLEEEYRIYLYRKEMTWWLKNRATWLEASDKNTKFFHKFASGRRNANAILEIDDGDVSVCLNEDIKNVVVGYFRNLYKKREE